MKRRYKGEELVLAATTQANIRDDGNASKSLMRPPPIPKSIKRPATAIPEDDYTSALSHIIERDYFPNLKELKAQHNYIDALNSKNAIWIETAAEDLSQVATEAATPYRERDGATPRGRFTDTPDSSHREADKPVFKSNNSTLPLDVFLSKYTSEDNESFNTILDTINKQQREKYAWAWNNNRKPSEKEATYQNLLAASAENDDAPKLIGGDKPASVDTWKHKPMNELMYGPDGVDAESTSFSRGGEKGIRRSGTAMSVASATTSFSSVPPSPSLSTIHNAITQTSDDDNDIPRVRGYAFVDPSPALTPETLGAPPLTWGTVGSTPLRVSQEPSTPSRFRIAETPRREALAQRMADAASKKQRQQNISKRGQSTPTMPNYPSSPNMRKIMTPAGKRLLERTIKGSSRGVDPLLKHTWTPTPRQQK